VISSVFLRVHILTSFALLIWSRFGLVCLIVLPDRHVVGRETSGAEGLSLKFLSGLFLLCLVVCCTLVRVSGYGRRLVASVLALHPFPPTVALGVVVVNPRGGCWNVVGEGGLSGSPWP